MTILAYDPELQLVLADEPSFPDQEAAAAACSAAESPLVIDEWQSYFVKFYNNDAPAYLREAAWVQKEYDSGVWELNFRNYVGLSRIGTINLEIRNKKISKQLYRAIIDDLAEKYASLVFSFGSPVGQHYKKEGIGSDSPFVEYLFLCRYLLHQTPNLEAIANLLISDPHRLLEVKSKRCTVDECQTITSSVVDAMLRSPMANLKENHPLRGTNLARIIQDKCGRALYPAEAVREVKYLNIDTNENRFIKFFLQALLNKTESLQRELLGKNGSYFNPEINENLIRLRKGLNHFLSHNIWRDVGKMQMIPAGSQVLQRKDGYKQLFALYSLLQLATHCDFLATDFKNLVEIKDVPTLYEYWCFFQIKAVLDTYSRLIKVSRFTNKSSLQHELTPGLCIEYESGLKLFFNKEYSGSGGCSDLTELFSYKAKGSSYSHNLRPDIVISQNDQKLIFDAKYKGTGHSRFYGEEEDGSITRWKNEDIDKMHCYREAIKGVVGSFILYPGSKDMIYPVHKSNGFCNGVGALALKPELGNMNKSLAESNIGKMISLFVHDPIK